MTALGVLGRARWPARSAARSTALIVIYGRLQPIVTTIATGAIYYGAALALRRVPGGDVNATLADALTGQLPGGVPASLALLLALVLVVWLPFRRSAIGRAAYAVGSSEVAAYMSGVPIRRAKFVAYTLSGLLASIAGLFLTFITYSGEASAANGSTYTLYSIAAVVLGGVSLFGGSGSAIGAIFGALMFRTIGDLLFVFNVEPLWQPLFQGVVLLGGGVPRLGAPAARPQPARPLWLRPAPRRAGALGRAVGGCAGASIRRSRAAFGCIVRRAARRQPLFAQLPVARIPAAAAEGRVLPRRHRDRHDDRDPARPDRPVGAVGRRRRRHDGDGGHRLGTARRGAGDSGRHRAAASRSGSSTASASPSCAFRR